MPRPYYTQFSDISSVISLSKTEQGSLKEVLDREIETEIKVQGLSVRRGQRVLDKVTGKRGEVLYGTRKTVIVPYSEGRG